MRGLRSWLLRHAGDAALRAELTDALAALGAEVVTSQRLAGRVVDARDERNHALAYARQAASSARWAPRWKALAKRLRAEAETCQRNEAMALAERDEAREEIARLDGCLHRNAIELRMVSDQAHRIALDRNQARSMADHHHAQADHWMNTWQKADDELAEARKLLGPEAQSCSLPARVKDLLGLLEESREMVQERDRVILAQGESLSLEEGEVARALDDLAAAVVEREATRAEAERMHKCHDAASKRAEGYESRWRDTLDELEIVRAEAERLAGIVRAIDPDGKLRNALVLSRFPSADDYCCTCWGAKGCTCACHQRPS